jgi:hypothetical protein
VASCSSKKRVFVYKRRRPDKTALYRLLQENLNTFYAEVQEASDGFSLPAYVRSELDAYMRCGLLQFGFSRLACADQDCGFEHIVAYSCKCRGVCGSCIARRMTQTADHLEGHVLPAVPYRQWTVSYPKMLRALLSHHPRLWSAVTTCALNKIFAWQKRHARKAGIQNPLTGSVTFLQRFGSMLQCSPHAHAWLPDGVFYLKDSGDLAFHVLAPPTAEDVERLLFQIANKTLQLCDKDFDQPEDEQAVLAHLQTEAVKAKLRAVGPAVGPELSAFCEGFSLHAGLSVHKKERKKLKKLLRYGMRPPFANKRLSYTGPDDNVVLKLRKPFYTGETEVHFTPTDFIAHLAAIIPPPYQNLVRYHGLFSNNHAQRALLQTLLPKKPLAPAVSPQQGEDDPEAEPIPEPFRPTWAQLLKSVFDLDMLVCPRCQGKMRLVASLTQSASIKTYLLAIGENPDPPQLAPARAPPQLTFDAFDPTDFDDDVL